MEFLYGILCICLTILCYFAYKFEQFRKKHNNAKTLLEQSMQIEIEKARAEYQRERLKELHEKRKETNIFREMAIDAIASQTLVYDPQTGRYVRRKQIN